MPDNTIWVQLGLAAPLVAILLYLLKQSADERKEITAAFIGALTTMVTESNDSRMKTAIEMGEMVEALRQHEKRSTQEHDRIVDAIGKMYLRGDAQ